MPVFYNLSSVEKREVLIVILQIVRNLDDTSLVKAWQQSIARTRLFFKLMEECLLLFEVNLYELLYMFNDIDYRFLPLCSCFGYNSIFVIIFLLTLAVLQHKKPSDGMLLGSSSRNPVGEAPASPKYSDRLSPAINNYLSEASRQEVRVSPPLLSQY